MSKKKINLGCGPIGKEDWINMDWGILAILSKMSFMLHLLINTRLLPKQYYVPWPKNLYIRDLRKKLPFSDSSIDYIYTSHFIEHLPRYQVTDLLLECKRVLKSSGVIRICVPDLIMLANKYINGEIKFFESLDNFDITRGKLTNLTDLFVKHFYGYDSWAKPTIIQRLQKVFIRGHLWMYDSDSLTSILYDVGFMFVERCQPGQGKVPDIDYLDTHREGSLFLEAFLT